MIIIIIMLLLAIIIINNTNNNNTITNNKITETSQTTVRIQDTLGGAGWEEIANRMKKY